MNIDEIIAKAIPLNMTCKIEQQKAIRRRMELKRNIEKLLNDNNKHILQVDETKIGLQVMSRML